MTTDLAQSRHLVALKEKLREMFQLDQAELDFGIYRIMNAKRDEVERFLDDDLLPQVQAALAAYQPAELVEKRQKLETAIAGAEAAGIDPEVAPSVMQLRAELEDAVDVGKLEEEVYSHLTTFFSRYYHDGDFMSLRRYKEGVYALPYEGEEVKLHWANADQYYIKTSESFQSYAFKVPQIIPAVPGASGSVAPRRVRFDLVSAGTERDNVKASAGKERRFILDGNQPLAMDGDELVIRFNYRADEEKRKQKDLSAEAVETILELHDDAPILTDIAEWNFWKDALSTKAPTAKTANRTLLEKHLTDYTAKNSFDYFIHKNLGRFLRQELDFFIKNEVMFLDDIESDTASRVEQYLSKIRVLRSIAHKFIDFLAQLEDFQKKLWLKKKFVLETNWLVTLDKVPEDLYPQIAANDAQLEEWVKLFAVDEIKSDLAGGVDYAEPLSVEFLKANPFLVLDTAFFDEAFKDELLSSFEDIDDEVDGLLVHGENFQGLQLLQDRYREHVRCIYIDPPYNTGGDDFVYKDSYQHSSWLSLIADRAELSCTFLKPLGVKAISLDSTEMGNLDSLVKTRMPQYVRMGEFVWKTRNTDNRVTTRFSTDHEYIHLFAKIEGSIEGRVIDRSDFKNPDNDKRGPYTTDPLTGKANAEDRPNLHYTITNPVSGDTYPPDSDFGWITDKSGFDSLLADDRVRWPRNPKTGKPRKKRFLYEASIKAPISSLGISISQGEGNTDLSSMMGSKLMNFPKPVSVIKRTVDSCAAETDMILDYFAGSGTTGQAVMRLNQDDNGNRRYCLIEVGDHFDNILKPRIAKTAYSTGWDAGKPTTRIGMTSCIKYIRLESYEDCLDNLTLSRTADQQKLVDEHGRFREDYMLRYMLDLEARGSVLDLEAFADPFGYKLSVVRDDERRDVTVDLVETFNYLLGLRVKTRERVRDVLEITGTSPEGEKVLILWRNVADKDNDALDDWFKKRGYNARDMEFDLIYVNGDNNIENLRRTDETWKVNLTEEAFHTLMFDVEDV
jgi:adenine-specific DNA-methyltransferase